MRTSISDIFARFKLWNTALSLSSIGMIIMFSYSVFYTPFLSCPLIGVLFKRIFQFTILYGSILNHTTFYDQQVAEFFLSNFYHFRLACIDSPSDNVHAALRCKFFRGFPTGVLITKCNALTNITFYP